MVGLLFWNFFLLKRREDEMAKRAKEKTAAVITIRAPGRMSKRGRRDIAAWLRRHAAMLVKEGDNYTHGRFTGRFIYT